MSHIDYLTQWAEPDGDQDTLADVRAEVRWLLKRAGDLERKLEAAKSVMWMAETYAEPGGMNGPDMCEFWAAKDIFDGQ